MSKVNGLQKEIPATDHSFSVEVEGEITKKRYVGDFTCKIPTRKDQCMIDKHRALLNGDMIDYLTPSTLAFHHKVAYLRYTLTESPKFWKDADLGYALYDANVVNEVYEQVLEFEKKWLKSVWGEDALEKFEVEPEADEPKSKKKTA